MTVGSEDGMRIIKEVTLGIHRREKTKELQEFRAKIEQDVAEIAEKGRVVDIKAG